MITILRIIAACRKCKTLRDFNRLDDCIVAWGIENKIDADTYVAMTWFISGMKVAMIRGLKL
jgi:hypothetical protein